MAVPRPLLLALIGVVLLVATFIATRGSSDESSSPSIPAAKAPAQTPEPAAPKQQKAEAPAAKPAEPKAKAKVATKPARVSGVAAVERALNGNRMVVLAFFQPGADDRATRAAVDSLSSRQAAVFTERIGQIGRYRDLIGSLGVSQAPAVVIIDREQKAHVVEGYVDAETLAQEVADARR